MRNVRFQLKRSYPEGIFFFGTGRNQFGQRLAQRIHKITGDPLVKIQVALTKKWFIIEYLGNGFYFFQIAGWNCSDNKTGAFSVAEGDKYAFTKVNFLLQTGRNFIGKEFV